MIGNVFYSVNDVNPIFRSPDMKRKKKRKDDKKSKHACLKTFTITKWIFYLGKMVKFIKSYLIILIQSMIHISIPLNSLSKNLEYGAKISTLVF